MIEDSNSGGDVTHEPVNPYADALSGVQPPEIAEFELNTDPYANMLPRVSQRSSALESDVEEQPASGPRPVLVAISVLLIVLLIVVPALTLIFARLGF